MKARIVEQPAKLYGEASSNSLSLFELPIGSEVELGGVKKSDGNAWVSVTLPNGQRGYVSGDARIFHIKQATLTQESVNVYAEPSAQSALTAQHKKNTRFYLLEVVKQADQGWVRVRDLSGKEGFISGQTKIKIIPETVKPSKAVGSKNMLYGALWCIGGILVTVVTYSAASAGGTYIVTWGAIIFGGLQFVQGLYQYLTSSD